MPRLLRLLEPSGGGVASDDDDSFWLAALLGVLAAAWVAAAVLLRARQRRGWGEEDAEAPPRDLEMAVLWDDAEAATGGRLLLRRRLQALWWR